jgi:hypothetical protein
MAPAEAADVVQRLEEQDGSLRVLDGKVANVDFGGLGVDVGEEFAVREGSVGAELVQDLGEGG